MEASTYYNNMTCVAPTFFRVDLFDVVIVRNKAFFRQIDSSIAFELRTPANYKLN